MSIKFLWGGLTLVTVASVFGWSTAFAIAGAIIMAVGVVLLILDK